MTSSKGNDIVSMSGNRRAARRLSYACLFIQIAIIEWLMQGLFYRLTELLYTHFQFDPTSFYVFEIPFVTGLARSVLLLAAVFMFTRGLRGLWAIAGGWLILNTLLITVLRQLLGLVNWTWSVGNGEPLVVTDPLQPYFQFMTPWMWAALWLLMILGAAAVAREISLRFEARLVKRSRIRNLMIIGLVCWGLWTANNYLAMRIMELMPEDSSIEAIVNVSTGYQLIAFIPPLLLCIMLFLAMRQVRTALRSPYHPPCPECGHTLDTNTADRCPECGWLAATSNQDET